MSEPSDIESGALRARARERIEQGRLPRAKALRTWGGLGSGLRCDLCDAPIADDEPEFELQLDGAPAGTPIRFHRLCHAIWNEAREECEPEGGWRPVSREMPPPGAVVEARLSLGGRRSIILSVVCLSSARASDESDPDGDGSAAPAEWANATTGGPLPEGWLPVEWRPLRGAGPASPSAAQSSKDRPDTGAAA